MSDATPWDDLPPLVRQGRLLSPPVVKIEDFRRDDRRKATHIIAAAAPYDTARLFRSVRYRAGDHPILFYHRGGFYLWSGTAYPELVADDLRANLYDFLDQCVILDKENRAQPFKPNKSRIANILDGLQAAANLPSTIVAPAWLDQVDLDPEDIIACTNGLLHLPSLDLLPHTPFSSLTTPSISPMRPMHRGQSNGSNSSHNCGRMIRNRSAPCRKYLVSA
jgi:hypothetical protein